MWSAATQIADASHLSARRTGALGARLGVVSLTALGIGASVGSGIFTMTGIAARATGPAVVLCFALAGASCLLSGLCYAELASRFPVAGGIYVYLRCSLGELPALLVVANLLIDYHVGAAVLARSLVAYAVGGLKAVPALGWLPDWLAALPVTGLLSFSPLAPLVVLCLTALLVLSAEHSDAANLTLTTIKVAIVVVLLVAGMRNADAALLVPFAPRGAESIVSTVALLAFSYTGFDAIANAAEEAIEPARAVPAAIALCIGACAALYGAVSLLLVACVPYDQIDVAAPIAQIFADGRGAGAAWALPLISIGAALGICTTLLVGLYAQARVLLGVARDAPLRLLRPLARVSAQKTPWLAQTYCGIVAAALSASLDVHELVPFLSAGVLLSYAAAAVAVLALRMARDADGARPPGAIAGIVAFVPAVAVCARLSVDDPFSFGWFGSIVAVALAALPFVMFARYAPPPGGFACPLVPMLPTVALASNVLLLAHLPWQAGARLGAIAVIVVVAFACGRELPVGSAQLRSPLFEDAALTRSDAVAAASETGSVAAAAVWTEAQTGSPLVSE